MSSAIEYSGKEIMRAIYFGDGPVLEQIPEIKSTINLSFFIHNPDEMKQVRGIHDAILNEVEKDEPGTFQDFKRKMESGDHVVIQQTMEIYAQKIIEVSKKLIPEFDLVSIHNESKKFAEIISKHIDSPHDQMAVKKLAENKEFVKETENLFENIRVQSVSGKISTTESNMCAVGPFAAAAVVVIYIMFVLAWIYYYTWFWTEWDDIFIATEKSDNHSLLKDQIVNSIAVNLKR
ncbi:MAG: hypothetical protein ABIM30_08850 [candidate division WOR-3 bacterium]